MNEDLFREFYSEVPPALASGKFARPVEHVTRGLDNVSFPRPSLMTLRTERTLF